METSKHGQKPPTNLGSYRTYEEWKRQQGDRSKRTGTVLTVPMRNGNQNVTRHISPETTWFLPYLWGMETTKRAGRKYRSPCVLTVPMRNGNTPCLRSFSKRGCLSSYRTYEEWKRPNAPSSILPSTVLTVPMRNGNASLLNSLTTTVTFLPYLWGMETTIPKRWIVAAL